MPFKSIAQAGYLSHHPGKIGGKAALEEWKSATDFSHLPQRASGGNKKMSSRFMQKASASIERRGTKGVFKAAAQRAGKSTRQYAEEKKHAPGKTGRRARLALAFMSARH